MNDARRRARRLVVYGGAALALVVVLAVTTGTVPALLGTLNRPGSAASAPTATAPVAAPRSETVPVPPEPVRAQTAAAGVTVELELSRGVMQLGERVWATVRIRNQNAEPVVWYSGGCAYPADVSTIADVPQQRSGRSWSADAAADFKEQALLDGLLLEAGRREVGFVPEDRVDAHGNFGCTTALLTHVLEPGGELTHRAAWDGAVAGAIPVAPGIYRITAVFGHAGVASQAQRPGHEVPNPFHVEAEIDLSVQAGPPEISLSPAEAVDVALADPRFAQQVAAAHSRDGFCCGAQVRFIGGVYEVSVTRNSLGLTMETAVVRVDPSSGEVAGLQIVEH